MSEYSILFIRTEEDPACKIEAALGDGLDAKLEWIRVEALFDGLRLLQERTFDLIISELFLPDGQGLPTLRHLKQHAPQTPVIVVCHAADRDTAVDAVRKGAHDFFCYEDLEPGNLRRSIAGAIRSEALSPAGENGADRRTHARFPCRLAVSYQALEHPFLSGTAESETVNISSKGLLFTTAEPLQTGQLLQVSVDWPARLENQVPLKLVAEGRIVRITGGQAAIRIDKYEFRTRKAKGPHAGTDEVARSAGKNQNGKNQTASRPVEAVDGSGSRLGTAAGIRTNGVRERHNV